MPRILKEIAWNNDLAVVLIVSCRSKLFHSSKDSNYMVIFSRIRKLIAASLAYI